MLKGIKKMMIFGGVYYVNQRYWVNECFWPFNSIIWNSINNRVFSIQ